MYRIVSYRWHWLSRSSAKVKAMGQIKFNVSGEKNVANVVDVSSGEGFLLNWETDKSIVKVTLSGQTMTFEFRKALPFGNPKHAGERKLTLCLLLDTTTTWFSLVVRMLCAAWSTPATIYRVPDAATWTIRPGPIARGDRSSRRHVYRPPSTRTTHVRNRSFPPRHCSVTLRHPCLHINL